jgi:hypothetical protein
MNCRVRIVNDVNGQTTIVETQRDRCAVYFDLAKMVRQVNRRRDNMLRASLHLLQDTIVLHWHNPWIAGAGLAAELLEIAEPLHRVEAIIWGKGGGA